MLFTSLITLMLFKWVFTYTKTMYTSHRENGHIAHLFSSGVLCKLRRGVQIFNTVLECPNYWNLVEFSYTTEYGAVQRRNEGLPKMQRAATQLINIQTFYSQRAVRLKIIVKYCHFCFEDLVFSKVCLDNFLV